MKIQERKYEKTALDLGQSARSVKYDADLSSTQKVSKENELIDSRSASANLEIEMESKISNLQSKGVEG